MGILNLTKFITKNIGRNHITSTSLEQLKHMTICIDMSIYKYKFISANVDRGLLNFIDYLKQFRIYDINLICVFDGIVPQEKSGEQKKRKAIKEQNVRQYQNCSSIHKSILECKNLDELKNQSYFSDVVKTLEKRSIETENLSFESMVENYSKYVETLEKRAVDINHNHDKILIDFCKVANIPYIIAPYEADWVLSDLVKFDDADYILSEDSDMYIFGHDYILNKTGPRDFNIIDLKQVYNSLGLSKESFIDMCILFGCDYNTKTKMIAHGPEKIYNLILKYERIEAIFEALGITDYSYLQVENCRKNFFRKNVKVNIDKTLYNKEIDREKFKAFLTELKYPYADMFIDHYTTSSSYGNFTRSNRREST
jgi:5'-3' exonuclease